MTSDEKLMEQVRNGDQAALTKLVERHHAPLVGYLYYAGNGQRLLAEDFAQEAFVRLIQHVATYEPGRPFKPWLYSIATNLLRDHFRRLETRQTTDWSDAFEEHAAQVEAEPENSLLRAERARQITAALLKLSEPLRITLVLRIYNDLSLNDIAQLLGIPVGTVKSRLSSAVHQLRELLSVESHEVSL